MVRVADADVVERFPAVAQGYVAGMSQADDARWRYGIVGAGDIDPSPELSGKLRTSV